MSKGLKLDVTIRGVQEAQRANEQMIAAMRPRGAFGHAIQAATAAVHRYAIGISHVDTGTMKASHRMKVRELTGVVDLDRTSRNPRSRTPAHEYGYHEHERGGSHAYYERTLREAGPGIGRRALQDVRSGLP